MLKIKTNNKMSGYLFPVVLICVLLYTGYIFYQFSRTEAANNFREQMPVSLNNAELSGFLALGPDVKNEAEIFDVTKGKVVKQVKLNRIMQSEAEKYIRSINGLYIKVKAFPESGYIVRIPLKPAVRVNSLYLNKYGIDTINEIFIVFPDEENPYLLTLDSSKRPYFYTFDGDTELMLNILGLSR